MHGHGKKTTTTRSTRAFLNKDCNNTGLAMSHSNETPFPSTPIACLENKKRKEIKRKDGKKEEKRPHA